MGEVADVVIQPWKVSWFLSCTETKEDTSFSHLICLGMNDYVEMHQDGQDSSTPCLSSQ